MNAGMDLTEVAREQRQDGHTQPYTDSWSRGQTQKCITEDCCTLLNKETGFVVQCWTEEARLANLSNGGLWRAVSMP